MPYSAFGTLRLAADIIEQGGVLRAPLGPGDRRGEHQRPHLARDAAARQRHLRQRTRPDDALWRHRRRRRLSMAGAGRAPDRPGRREYHGSLSVGLQLAGQTVQVGDNALVDLSGGGQLLGAGFISGRGGSTDARFNPLVQTNPQGGFTLPGLSTNPVYALVPGAQPMAAPTAPDAGQSQPQIGQQVTIGAGARIAGRHLHADAVHLRPDARRLPRRDQRRDARPGCCRRAAAAQWLLVHRRPPGQCLGRYRRRRAAPVADQLGPGAAPVLAVQRNGLRRLRGGRARRGRARWRRPMPARCACYWPGRAGRVLQLRRPGRFLGRSRRQRHARGRFHEQLAGRVGNHRARRRPQRRIQRPLAGLGPAQPPGRAAPDGGRHAGRGLPEHRQHCLFRLRHHPLPEHRAARGAS